MSSTNTASDELRKILTECCNLKWYFPDVTKSIKSLLTDVSEDLSYNLISSITDSDGYTVLTLAASRGYTEMCVTLLSSLPQADRLKLILDDKHTALHSAAAEGHTETVSGELNGLTAEQRLDLLFTGHIIGGTALHYAAREGHTETVKTMLDNLTPEQQLKLLITQNSDGDTALHEAAREGRTETVTTLLDNLTPEQQLQLLSVQNKEGKTAYEEAAGHYITGVEKTLEHYQKEADYRVNYRKFASLINNF